MGSADWQPAPPIATGSPVTFQIGSVGAGIGVGCGVGIGFGGPLSLGALPIFGQAVQGLSAGLGGVLPALNGAGAAARAAVKGLGIQGLDVGVGCGVGMGYGFGAGLMVKPSVVEYAVKSGSQLLGQFTHAASSKLQAAGISPSLSSHPQHRLSSSDSTINPSTSSMPAVGPYFSSAGSSPAVAPPPVGSTIGALGFGDVSGMTGGPAIGSISPTLGTVPGQHEELAHRHPQQTTDISNHSNSSDASGQQKQQVGAEHRHQHQQQDVLVLRTLLQQQEEITQLKKQNKQLRQAVCKLDPRAPFCGTSGKNKRIRQLQSGADSSDWPG